MTWGTFSTCQFGLFSSTLKTCSTKTSQSLHDKAQRVRGAGFQPARESLRMPRFGVSSKTKPTMTGQIENLSHS